MDKKLDEFTAPGATDASDRDVQSWSRRPIGRDVIKLLVSGGIMAVSVVAFLWLGESESPSRKPPPKPSGVAVQVEPLRSHEGSVTIETNGVVVPFREISIAAEVGGRVIEQSNNLRAGRRVARDEPLIRIDPTEYEIEVRRLLALEAEAKAQLDALDVTVKNTSEMLALSKEELELQRTEMVRIENLRARSASSASETAEARRAELTARAAVVRVENELRDSAAQRTLLEQRLKLTQVQLERATLDLSRTTIRSPVDGIVAQSMVEEQAYVAPGQPFARIEDASAMEVRCNLTMDEMHWLWNHRNDSSPISADIRCQIGDTWHLWRAQFERVDGTGIDDSTRTVPCLFRVAGHDAVSTIVNDFDPEGKTELSDSRRSRPLIRGMFVSVHIDAVPDRDFFQVPSHAIRPGKRVWVNDGGSLRVAQVTVVSRFEGETVIESEQLSRGDQIITSPVPGARDGLVVTIGGPRPRGNRGAGGGIPQEPRAKPAGNTTVQSREVPVSSVPVVGGTDP